jgi:hypothetical protein
MIFLGKEPEDGGSYSLRKNRFYLFGSLSKKKIQRRIIGNGNDILSKC